MLSVGTQGHQVPQGYPGAPAVLTASDRLPSSSTTTSQLIATLFLKQALQYLSLRPSCVPRQTAVRITCGKLHLAYLACHRQCRVQRLRPLIVRKCLWKPLAERVERRAVEVQVRQVRQAVALRLAEAGKKALEVAGARGRGARAQQRSLQVR